MRRHFAAKLDLVRSPRVGVSHRLPGVDAEVGPSENCDLSIDPGRIAQTRQMGAVVPVCLESA
jgi:hypothetical protein